MPVGKPLHLRLFLEGEEVPVIAAQVSINTSSPATASIQIIPLDEGMDFLPRTMVHLFFLDTRVDTTQGPQQPGASALKGTYRLLFSGEIVGFAYSQTPASRGIILQCLDFSNYWDSANVMAISYGPGGNAFTNDGSLNGAASGMFTDIPGDSAAEHLVRWVKSKPVTKGLTGISGLAGGVIHILEAMGGVPGHFKGVNDFYTIAELRCRLLNQITAEENDSTAARVLSIGVFEEWLKNGIEQAGGNITFRDVMKLLFQYIYYEFVPNPAPKFDDGSSNKISNSNTTALTANPSVAGIKTRLDEMRQSLIILNGQITVMATNVLIATVSGLSTLLTAILKDLTALGQTPADLIKARSSVQQALNSLNKLKTATSSSIESRLASLPETWKALEDAIAFLDGGSVTSKSLSTSYESQRLRTQIIRPDCWFASPPACNVIFPEMYAQISYDRNYLQETTRLLVHTFNTLIGKDHLLAGHILAPFIGLDSQKLSKYKGSKSYRILMDHEIHVGIIPKTEWIPNTAGVGHPLNTEQMKKVKDGRLSWLIKASLFHFFKYRFASRQVSVSGRFNPFLVCGFPGVVVTKPYIIPGGAADLRAAHNGQPVPDSEINTVIHQKASDLHAPSHFVGMIGAVQHSIDQSGGTTTAVLHHARKHRGIDDEFIGVLAATNEGKSKRIVKVILEINKAQELATQQNPNTKPLELLLGVTPQTVQTQTAPTSSAKPSKLKAVASTKTAKKVSVDPRSIKAGVADALSVLKSSPAQPTVDEQFEATFGSTQVSEQDANMSQGAPKKYPPRTASGSIPEVNRTDILVPMGSTKIKVNDKKGLYGGKIVGIEILGEVGAQVVEVSFDATSKVVKYQNVTGVQASFNSAVSVGASGADQTLTAATLAKTTKTVKTTTRGVAFSNVAIYEEIDIAVSGSLPIEEVLRPSWFSTAYANQNIGEKIYKPFFGCGAVVDGLSVSGTSQSSDASSDAEPVDAETSAGDLVKRLQAEEQAKRDNSLEKALNVLGYQYGQIKSQGMDVDSFIRDYTDRPIATFQDIFGEPGLKFSVTDSAVGGNAKVQQVTVNGTPRTPKVGFHTGATHPDLAVKGKLVGLTTDLQLGFTRVNGVGKNEPLVQQYDVRPAKKQKVIAYLTALGRGPGFRG